MAHEAHPNPNPHDDPTSVPVIMVGVVGSLITVATIIALVGLFNSTNDAMLAAQFDATATKVELLHAEQEGEISRYRMLDTRQGVVGLKIDRAIELVSRELPASKDGRGRWSPAVDTNSHTAPSTPPDAGADGGADAGDGLETGSASGAG